MSSDQTISDFVHKLLGNEAWVPEAAVVGPDRVVTPNASRCVECGVCGFNCPVGIPVRDYARQGQCVDDPRCVQCGQCIAVCPRGTLRWAPIPQARRQHLLDLEAQLLADGIGLGHAARRNDNEEFKAG